jgi:serine/threonine protein kinase
MEFLPGGDLMTMLMKYDVFSEDVTRFYMAECTLAIEAVHNLGFIHRCVIHSYACSGEYNRLIFFANRDIKPDNILIDKNGHLKLSDFGLSTGMHGRTEGAYYARLIEQQLAPRHASRNSVEVTPIHLTMTRAETIATWKKNRRRLVCDTL